MKTWIDFEFTGKSASGKTKEWRVFPKDKPYLHACLGTVKWYAPWRKYAFNPYAGTVFEQDCLRTIADFCERKTQEHKERAS